MIKKIQTSKLAQNNATCYKQAKKMNFSSKFIVSLSAVLALAGCNRRDYSPFDRSGRDARNYRQGSYGPLNGARIGAVLTSDENCGVGQNTARTTQNNGGLPSGFVPFDSKSGATFASGSGNRSTVHSLSIRPSNVYAPSLTSYSGSSAGFVTSSSRVIEGTGSGSGSGISGQFKSEVEYSSDGSTLIVSTPSKNGLTFIPVNPSGGFGQPYFSDQAKSTHALASAHTPVGELAMAANTDGSVSIYRGINRDYATGAIHFVASRSDFRPGSMPNGMVTDVAFSPDGNFAFFAYDQTINVPNNPGVGRIIVCDVRTLINVPEDSLDTGSRRGYFGRGCAPINGTFVTQDRPKRLAVSPYALVTSSVHTGVWMNALPRNSSEDIDSLFTDVYGSIVQGIPVTLSSDAIYNGNESALSKNFKDVVIHPGSNNLIATEGSRVLVYDMDNQVQIGTYNDQKDLGANAKPTDLAMDTGTVRKDGAPNFNGEFALAADEGQNRVWILNLDERSVYINVATDYIPTQCKPYSVAIKPKMALRPPVAPVQQNNPAGQPAGNAPITNPSLTTP